MRLMPNAFVRNLKRRIALSEDDLASAASICSMARHYPGKQDLIREGDEPGPLFAFLEGWGYRYKILPEGTRQVLGFMLPGDFCDMHTSVLREMDHSIATVTPCLVAAIDRAKLQEFVERTPTITHAFWLLQLIDLGVARSWIVSMGRRGSEARVAHLMCELFIRANAAGLATGTTCAMPISQILLSDALGLTPVHVNRVLRTFRTQGIMHLAKGELIIDDISELVAVAGFNDVYLQRRLNAVPVTSM